MQLLELPEEVLEIILYYALTSSPSPSAGATQSARASFLSVLLTSTTLYRIGTPILYHSVSASSSETTALLARTLEEHPDDCAPYIRILNTRALYPTFPKLLSLLASSKLAYLEIVCDFRFTSDDVDFHRATSSHVLPNADDSTVKASLHASIAHELCSAFGSMAPGPHTLVLKRSPPTLSTKEYVNAVLGGLACALPSWTALRRFETSFHLVAPRPVGSTSEPIDIDDGAGTERALPQALACAPNLQSLRVQIPNAWSPALLLVASSSSLQRIEITGTRVSARARRAPVIEPVPGTVTEEYYRLFPSAANSNASDSLGALATTSAPSSLSGSPAASGVSLLSPSATAEPSLAERLRGPVEVISRFGRFIDRTDKTLTIEQRTLTREQILHDGEGGVSAWLVEARKHPRLLDLVLNGVLDAE